MKLFCILTVVMVPEVYACDKTKSFLELNKHINTQMNECKTSKICTIRLMDYVDVNFLVLLLYLVIQKVMVSKWVKDMQDLPVLIFTVACESIIISKKKFKKKITGHKIHWKYKENMYIWALFSKIV